MASIFGPSSADLEHLRTTVRALGTTSVPGLAAALAWRERKTEKLLAHELGRPDTPLRYDPSRRTVRWGAVLEVPTPVVTPAVPATPSTTATAPTTPRAPSPVYTPTGLKTLCPSCHVALQSTGSSGLVVCPQCGRLSSARSGAVAATPAPDVASPPSSSGPTRTVGPTGTPTVLSDRRSQEMFAAWVTNQTIPCPKCRTPLRHRGVSEYLCPACGQSIRFGSLPAPAGAAAPAR